MAPGRPLLSVLLPIWNERPHIAPLVAAWRNVGYAPVELILCVGGADGSLEEARCMAGPDTVVLEQYPDEGKQLALARCFLASRGDLLFLTDADARPTTQVVLDTLAPLLAGQAEATTGSREPFAEQQHLPLVAYQWALEAAGAGRSAGGPPGLLGSNAALTRAAAGRVGGFSWPAATGTDLTLACLLHRAGIRIGGVPASRMPVAFTTGFRAYSRQRSRWLRNLVIVGCRFGDRRLIAQGVRPMLIGTFWIVLLLVPGRARRLARYLALALLGAGWQRRIAYVRAAPAGVSRALPRRRWLLLLLYTAVDFVTWARAGAECLVPTLRKRW